MGIHTRAYLSTMPAGRGERRLAYAVLGVSALVFVLLLPFARTQLAQIPAFIPLYQSALATSDLVTAALLFGQYALLKSRAVLALACGYVFSAAMALVHLVTFPDLFAPGGLLGAGPQTTAWLYMFWHAGFPLFVAAYALLRDREQPIGRPGWAAAGALALVAAAVAAPAWLAAAGHDLLPAIMQGNRYTPAMQGTVAGVWALSLLALFLLWKKRSTVLDLCLIVVLGAWIFDIALGAVFNGGRFDLGFYAGRVYGLLAASFVLVVLLVENSFIHGELDSLNAQLEERVAARTRELQEAIRDAQFSRQRLAGIIDTAMDAVISVDAGQRVVLFNAAAEAIFRCPRDEAIGAPLAQFIPARFHSQHGALMRRFGETAGRSRRMSANRVVTALRRDGEEFPIDASISHFRVEGGEYYTVILRDVTERVRTEEALRRSREELMEVARVSATAREQERSRIARELHDELAQGLTAVKMDVAAIGHELGAADARLAARVREMQQMLDHMIAATRRIAADLRPLMLDELGLAAAADWLVTGFTGRHGIDCTLEMDPPELDVPDPYATAVFRILQESLNNVAKHAGAMRVQVTLRHSGDAISLSVRDDGRGFETASPRRPASFGLVGLRERVYLVGGTMSIESAPGAGTTIELTIPLQPLAAMAPA